jgi:hypothetical protein
VIGGYTVHDATGAVLTTVPCPVDAHRLLRELDDAESWRLPSGAIGGIKLHTRRRGRR